VTAYAQQQGSVQHAAAGPQLVPPTPLPVQRQPGLQYHQPFLAPNQQPNAPRTQQSASAQHAPAGAQPPPLTPSPASRLLTGFGRRKTRQKPPRTGFKWIPSRLKTAPQNQLGRRRGQPPVQQNPPAGLQALYGNARQAPLRLSRYQGNIWRKGARQAMQAYNNRGPPQQQGKSATPPTGTQWTSEAGRARTPLHVMRGAYRAEGTHSESDASSGSWYSDRSSNQTQSVHDS
jgi:hypothetical protein